MPKLTVVVPCYNEQEALPLFYKEIVKIAKGMCEAEFEFLFIDDGSVDATLSTLKQLYVKDSRVRYISFSRNFGKEAAMLAGLEHAKGEYIAIMDADMQDPPLLLPQMLGILMGSEEFDCVAARRINRKGEPIIRSMFAQGFYRLINKISKTEIVEGARDFRLMTRKMVDAILSVKEYNRFSKGIFNWVGFKTKWVEYHNKKRVAGKTKWSFWKLFIYSLDGIIAFSTAPLAIASFSGIVFCILSFIMAMVYAIKAMVWGDPVSGFPTLICVILLVGGIQLFCMGILGQYLAKTYLETKGRPIYIVKETEAQRQSLSNESTLINR